MEKLSTGTPPSLISRILLTIGKTSLAVILGGLYSFLLARPIGKLIPGEMREALDAGINADAPVGVLILTYLIITIGSLMAIYTVRRRISRQSLRSAGFGTSKWLRELGEGWLLGMLLVLTGYVLMLLTGMAQSEGWYFLPATFLGWFLLFLIQPFFEELVFRGFLMSILIRYFDKRVALIVSAVAFALVHGTNDGFSLIGFLSIMVAGFLFGLLFLKSGQLWLPTAMHAAWNFTQGVICGFPTSGIETYALTRTTTSGPDWLSGGVFGFEGSILALLLLIAAVWWYRDSFRQEKLSEIITQSHIPRSVVVKNDLSDD